VRRVLSSTAFYAQAVVIMAQAARKARRGELDNAALVAGSHALVRALKRVGVSFDVSGTERLGEQRGPFVFVANHNSPLETQVLPAILEAAAPCTFIVKAGLTGYPILGPVLRAFDPIIVGRTDPRADLELVLREGTARLRRGISVIVFPQAHRALAFDPRTFNTLGMRLARRAKVPLVPIALETHTWTRGRPIRDIGWIVPTRPARFAIGLPTPVETNGSEAHRQVVSFIESHLARWAGGSR